MNLNLRNNSCLWLRQFCIAVREMLKESLLDVEDRNSMRSINSAAAEHSNRVDRYFRDQVLM